MHIVLPTIGSAGDVYPILAIGIQLQRRGHRVTIITNPYFRELIEGHRLELVPLGTRSDYLQSTRDPTLWHPQRGFNVVVEKALRPAIPLVFDYLSNLDHSNLVVASSSLAFGARIAQEVYGFRMLTLHLQPSIIMSAVDPPVLGGIRLPDWAPLALREFWIGLLDRFYTDPLLCPSINQFRASLGLSPVKHVFRHWMHSPDGVLGLFPPWFSPPPRDWPQPFHTTGFIRFNQPENEGLSDLSKYMASGSAPFVFTPGSAMRHGRMFFKTAVEAVSRLGGRAILLSRFPEQIPERLPPGIIHREWLPLRKVLPHAAALVYHGGIGTVAETLAAGIPHLVVPFAHDQPDNARRLELLGVGKQLSPKRLNPTRLASKLSDLLADSEIRTRAKTMRAKVDFDTSLDLTCELIERR